jgi:glycosyltransferase involved in cell wall biosynthesis
MFMGVSIIVPAYNSEKFLAATIQSVLAQSVGDWELVVVNDGSTDRTGTLADTFARTDNRIRVVHQANAGPPRTRNRGFTETRADYAYCLFLDSDDLLEPDALEILVQALEQDPAAVAAYGRARYIDSEGEPLTINGSYLKSCHRRAIQGKWLKVWPVSAPTTFEVLAFANPVPCCAMMRRTQKEEAGDFDPNFIVCDDSDMWRRLSRLGHIVFVNRVVFAIRKHERNLSREHGQLLYDYELRGRKKLYASPDLDARHKRIILLGHRYFELYSAKANLRRTFRKLSAGKLTAACKYWQLTMKHIISAIKGDL